MVNEDGVKNGKESVVTLNPASSNGQGGGGGGQPGSESSEDEREGTNLLPYLPVNYYQFSYYKITFESFKTRTYQKFHRFFAVKTGFKC